MLHLLKRHPFAIKAFFRQSLVLTYAFPRAILEPLLPPGLVLDTYREYGFLAIAMVKTARMRPAFLPAAFGGDSFLSGYRIFTRLGSSRSSLRGLKILSSDTDRPWLACAGNLLTNYRYRLCRVVLSRQAGKLDWNIQTPDQEADLHVIAHVLDRPATLPQGSPFSTLKDARTFAGPLPYTFHYEAETHSIIRVKGVRQEWNPQPVAVEFLQNTFLHKEPFRRVTPLLANAFYVHDVPYRWQRGTRSSVAPL